MDAQRAQIVAFNQPAIPLLIKAWDEKALPHLGERKIVGAIVGRVSITCSEPSNVFDQGTAKHWLEDGTFSCCLAFVSVNLWTTRMLMCHGTDSSDLLIVWETSIWRKYFFVNHWPERGGCKGPLISVLGESSMMKGATLRIRQHSHTSPSDCVISLRWFQTKMISALYAWRWSVISSFEISSPSPSLR